MTITKMKIGDSFSMPKTTLFTIVNKTKIMEAFEQSKFEAHKENDYAPLCTKAALKAPC